jgi:hypothetical protein
MAINDLVIPQVCLADARFTANLFCVDQDYFLNKYLEAYVSAKKLCDEVGFNIYERHELALLETCYIISCLQEEKP